MKRFDVHATSALAVRAAAEAFVAIASKAIQNHGMFSVALSGGTTPRSMYKRLASKEYASRVDWSRVVACWGDERCVPPDNDESNYRMARETLLSKVPIVPKNIHRIKGELVPQTAADEYNDALTTLFNLEEGSFPRFDLVLLGVGDNGHTASLFPHTAVVDEKKRLVAAPYIEELDAHRITLTPPVLTNAAIVLFLVLGDHKAGIVQSVVESSYEPTRYPAQLLRNASGAVTWIMDTAAASKLTPGR
ncbi:MAG: 6-phosphogluconolactonase [Candidatus Latescibacterota bacterium]|jgi:6-phosphogluconolactonase